MAAKVRYRVNTKNLGWTAWVQSGAVAGNPDDLTDNLLAIEVVLDGAADGIHITYAVNVQQPDFWTALCSDGNTAGTPGSALALDKIYMDLVNAGENILLYRVSVNPIRWTAWNISSNTNSTDGVGLDGFPIQALQILLTKT